jgi:predicted RNA polymerase sigma factor
LHRAVAVAEVHGPAVGLQIVDVLVDHGALGQYPLLFAVRADLLTTLGRIEEAATDLRRAAQLAGTDRERRLYLDRANTVST